MSKADTAGVYHLVLHASQATTLQVGKLGTFTFPAGYYVYTGSAMGGLGVRLGRHRRRRKKLRWHIDYLLQQADLVDVLTVATWRRMECRLNRRVLNIEGARVVAPGFGSSDCRCPSHLIYVGAEPPRIPAS